MLDDFTVAQLDSPSLAPANQPERLLRRFGAVAVLDPNPLALSAPFGYPARTQ
jgi:hypothetical protein